MFRDAPTDADYAMELIAKRVATGQEVTTPSPRTQLHRTSNASSSTDNLTPTLRESSHEVHSSEDDGINWKKWGERVARGKSFLEEGRQLLSTHVRSPQTGLPLQTSRNPMSGETTTSHHQAGAEDEHSNYATLSVVSISRRTFLISILGTIRLFPRIDHIDIFYLVFHTPHGDSHKTHLAP